MVDLKFYQTHKSVSSNCKTRWKHSNKVVAQKEVLQTHPKDTMIVYGLLTISLGVHVITMQCRDLDAEDGKGKALNFERGTCTF